jgi:hypothetical protein
MPILLDQISHSSKKINQHDGKIGPVAFMLSMIIVNMDSLDFDINPPLTTGLISNVHLRGNALL